MDTKALASSTNRPCQSTHLAGGHARLGLVHELRPDQVRRVQRDAGLVQELEPRVGGVRHRFCQQQPHGRRHAVVAPRHLNSTQGPSRPQGCQRSQPLRACGFSKTTPQQVQMCAAMDPATLVRTCDSGGDVVQTGWRWPARQHMELEKFEEASHARWSSPTLTRFDTSRPWNRWPCG